MNNALQFFSEVRVELGKVVWPTFDSFIESTAVVLALIFAFAVYLGALDKGLTVLVLYIFKYFG